MLQCYANENDKMLPRDQYDSVQKGVEGILEAVQEQRISLGCLFVWISIILVSGKEISNDITATIKEEKKTADNKSCLSEILIVNFSLLFAVLPNSNKLEQ